MNIKDFKVGQTVYVELTGDASRGKTPEQCIEEWEITSVGRKYIKACKKESRIFRFETTFEFQDYNERFVEKSAYSKKNMFSMPQNRRLRKNTRKADCFGRLNSGSVMVRKGIFR